MSSRKPDLLDDAASRAARYVNDIGNRHAIAPPPEDIARLDALGGELNDAPVDPTEVIALLDDCGSPATIASTGPRYFGFVTGGSLPASMAANWLAGAWDQNAALFVQSPVSSRLEEISSAWLLDLLALPASCGMGFVTGATMANFTALAAARHALLARAGWDHRRTRLVRRTGNHGRRRSRSSRIDVESCVDARLRAKTRRHRACRQSGTHDRERSGRRSTIARSSRSRPATSTAAPSILPQKFVRRLARPGRGCTSTARSDCGPPRRPAVRTSSKDSRTPIRGRPIACKWLNVPYDSGLAIVRDPENLRAAMTVRAAYLMMGEHREPWQYVPEASRRSRAVEIWAALRLARTAPASPK